MKHTQSINEYHIPSYIDEYVKQGKISILEKPDFIPMEIIEIDLESNIIREMLDGEKSEETVSKFADDFSPSDDWVGGWNPQLGPMAVFKNELKGGKIKKRPIGYTHRCRGSEEAELLDIPGIVIEITDIKNEKEILTDLYVKEQTYKRVTQYDPTTGDILKSLYTYKREYEISNLDYDISDLEEFLKTKISDIWGKDSTSTSMLKLIAKCVGIKSTYSVTNYSTTKLAQNFIDKKYDGNSDYLGIGKISKKLKFSSDSSKSVPQNIIENDGTFYKPIFIYDDLLRRDWFTVQEMAGELYDSKSETKIMLFFGVGGGSLPTDETIEPRRKRMIKRYEKAISRLQTEVSDYILTGGWFPSDTDSNRNSILDYEEIRREVNS